MSFTIPSRDLIVRYGGRGPRYTSYPPVPVWTDDVGPTEYRTALELASGVAQPLSLYVHIPFCRHRCWYCGCNVTIQTESEAADDYIERLSLEAAAVGPLLGDRAVASVHFGGGTPNSLTQEQMDRLLGILKRRFNLSRETHLDIEVDPRVATPEQVAWLGSLGFRRMSFGVQDTDPAVGEAVGRSMDVEHLTAIVAAARGAGVKGINLDLIYGLPKQTQATMETTLKEIVGLNPDRIALYGYAHVPWIRPQQRRLERSGLPGADDRITLFGTALESLGSAGYEAVGLDHFALPGDPLLEARADGTLDRSFQGYTVGRAPDLVGLGASSIGLLRSADHGIYIQNITNTKPYQRSTGLATAKGYQLNADDVRRGQIIRDVLCRLEVQGEGLWDTYPEVYEALASYEADGLVERKPDHLQVTELGRFFLRPIAMHFDAYLGKSAPEKPAPRYSAVV